MERGWKATGRLTPVYEKVGGVDRLASLSGISRQTLSAYNTGKRGMGMKNAVKIGEAAGVSVVDLGAPVAGVSPQAVTLADLATRMEAMEENQRELAKVIQRLANAVGVNSMSLDRLTGRVPGDSALRPRRRAL